MIDLVVEEVACSVCGAPKGEPCTRMDSSCGGRRDDFAAHGSQGARLLEHLFVLVQAREFAGPAMVAAMSTCDGLLTEKEVADWNKGKDNAIDMLFQAIDEWCCAGRFDRVDAFLYALDPKTLNTTMIVGVLSITLSLHTRPARQIFAQAAKEHLLQVCPERVPRMLSGLQCEGT
jgi:hypothetical protein